MDNVSALSVNMVAPQGRAGPGTWGRTSDGGFIDFITAVMDRNEPYAVQAEPVRNTETQAVIWTAPRTAAAATIDKDVESVVPPRYAARLDDLVQLIALLAGEEENDGFLYALEQYIQKTPGFLAMIEAFPAGVKETRLFDLLALLREFVQAIPEEELPPELAPLESLIAMFIPVIPEPAEANGNGAEVIGIEADGNDPAARAETETIVQTGQTETQELQGKAETTANQAPATDDKAPVILTREIPQDVEARVKEIRIAPQRRVAYNPFAAVRASLITQAYAIQEQTVKAGTAVETAAEAEEPVVWDLSEEMEPVVDLGEQEEAAIDAKPAAAGPLPQPRILQTEAPQAEALQTEAPQAETPQAETPQIEVPQAETPEAGVPQAEAPQQPAQTVQTVETTAARQVTAGRIIDQIMAQTAKAPDVSMLQMELHPKFLGRIQLVIEATAEGMRARLLSDNSSVRSLLNEHIADLKASLREAGINMKDIEITEARVGTQLTDKRFQQDGAEEAKEQAGKIKGLTAITSVDERENTEPAAAYATGRVSGGGGGESQFDYRA